MPLDPSIISSYNPGAGIDVNALMQQRMQGMENINALERQRKADDLAMQDRAAAQQKAQADAAVKALLPAYAYGFQNPSDPDGMLALVPADQQAALAPYIEQIRNKSPEQVIAALTGSLVTSEPGRAFLENQARQRTYQVQLQQAETAAAREAREAAAVGVPKPMSAYEAERVKLDREKAEREAAAAGQPKPMSAYEAERIKLDREKAEREAKKVSPEVAKQQQAAREIDTAITKISEVAQPGGLIDMSTNSIVGNLLDDIVAQTSGGFITLPGDVAAAQMEVIAHLARMAVPRFEGPQGEKDAAIYERASGQLSDPNTSNTTKRAAAQTVVELLKARRDQFVFSGAADGGGTDGGGDSGVLQYDEDGNLIE